MPWLDTEAPSAPRKLKANKAHGVNLSWEPAGDETYYAIYRFDGGNAGSIDDPANLLGTFRRTGNGTQHFSDDTVIKHQTYTYVVTAIDRLHNESAETAALTVKAGGTGTPPGKSK